MTVANLPEARLAQLRRIPAEDEAWMDLFPVWVARRSQDTRGPLVLGTYAVVGELLSFTPRFTWAPGVHYRAKVVYAASAQRARGEMGSSVEIDFQFQRPSSGASAVVSAVYPSRGDLPENLLKFYVHFSHPMSRGGSYQHVELVDSSGAVVPEPFVKLQEELWDKSGSRITLLLDPGRIKRGLKPHEEVGPALEQGRRYTLVIRPTWFDANRVPLSSSHAKVFRVVAPDSGQPSIDRWRLSAPAVGSREPLVVEFCESLDHALLQHAIAVSRDRNELGGKIEVGEKEMEWRFTPDQPWRAGRHFLAVDATLEDLAGNSLGRPFEVDLSRGHSTRPAPRGFRRVFEPQVNVRNPDPLRQNQSSRVEDPPHAAGVRRATVSQEIDR